ncbi:MAG: glycosyltransferase family 39 protein, partial [Vicinamibacteria bacterium]|nr:glycosyltransferase family 39 protein [Vicinamibacteria bacterium]
MTSITDALIALCVAFFLNMFILSRIHARLGGAEGDFLAKTYTRTMLIRCIGAILLNIYTANSQFADMFWGDSSTYDNGGVVLAQRWAGDAYIDYLPLNSVSGYGFYYVVGFLYSIFGRNQLLVQLLNATIGSLAMVLVYLIAKRLFDVPTAQWAAVFMAYFPQMIFWSCAMYKDPAILFCIALTIYSVLRLRERFTLTWIVFYVAASLSLMTLRFYVFYMVVFATLGTFVFGQRRGLFGGLTAQIVLAGIFLLAMSLGVQREQIERQQSYFDWEKFQTARLGQATLAQSGYGAEQDVLSTDSAWVV